MPETVFVTGGVRMSGSQQYLREITKLTAAAIANRVAQTQS